MSNAIGVIQQQNHHIIKTILKLSGTKQYSTGIKARSICTRTRPDEMGDVLSGEPQTPRRSLTYLYLGRSKYAYHKLQNEVPGAVFLTPQGPAATKICAKDKWTWDCHWQLFERGFGRCLNEKINWKNQVGSF